jgi:hypothetical protein
VHTSLKTAEEAEQLRCENLTTTHQVQAAELARGDIWKWFPLGAPRGDLPGVAPFGATRISTVGGATRTLTAEAKAGGNEPAEDGTRDGDEVTVLCDTPIAVRLFWGAVGAGGGEGARGAGAPDCVEESEGSVQEPLFVVFVAKVRGFFLGNTGGG